MKNILLMMLIFSAFFFNGVELGRYSCTHLRGCDKFGVMLNCIYCCEDHGHYNAYLYKCICICKT
uniref:GKTx n=1 Tax=Centruroides hentzi TaxID=88313 RepID=A0A2I9LP06_9SCOR